MHADRNSYVKSSDLAAGDLILIENERKGKLQLVYNPDPCTITQKKGSMITVQDIIVL